MSDSPISGADVSVRNTETNVQAKARTNDQGYHRFPILKIGKYEIA